MAEKQKKEETPWNVVYFLIAFVVGNILSFFLIKPVYDRNLDAIGQPLSNVLYIGGDIFMVAMVFYFIKLFQDH